MDNVIAWAIEQTEQLLRNTCREFVTPTSSFKNLIQYLLSNKRDDEEGRSYKYNKLLKQAKDKFENNNLNTSNTTNEKYIVDLPKFNNNDNDNDNDNDDDNDNDNNNDDDDNKNNNEINNHNSTSNNKNNDDNDDNNFEQKTSTINNKSFKFLKNKSGKKYIYFK